MFNNLFKKESGSGFTLIELLVVMAIIAVLVSIIIYAISAARLQSRNSQRRGNANSIRSALESYYSNKKTYPAYSNQSFKQIADDLKGQGYLNSQDTTAFTDPSGEESRQCFYSNGTAKYKMYIIAEPSTSVNCSADFNIPGSVEDMSQI